MKEKFLKIFITVLFICLVFLSTGCSRKKNVVNIEQEQTIYAVNASQAVKTNLDDYLDFGGNVETVSSVSVFSEVAGKLNAYYTSVGKYVMKGTVIADVDPSRAGTTYSVSQVKAPVSGTITSMPFSVGSTVTQSVPLVTISSTNRLEITAEVAERYLSKIKTNQIAYLKFAAYPSEFFTARVYQISPVLNDSTRTISLKLSIEPPDSKIKAGMYARIKLITANYQDVLCVPYKSILMEGKENYVFVLNDDNTVTKKLVVPGIRVDDLIQITEGLTENEKIIIKGQNLLSDGAKVNVLFLENAVTE
jgi:multidrug efflux pump subunit AcrA (membrane-fusion protein)